MVIFSRSRRSCATSAGWLLSSDAWRAHSSSYLLGGGAGKHGQGGDGQQNESETKTLRAVRSAGKKLSPNEGAWTQNALGFTAQKCHLQCRLAKTSANKLNRMRKLQAHCPPPSLVQVAGVEDGQHLVQPAKGGRILQRLGNRVHQQLRKAVHALAQQRRQPNVHRQGGLEVGGQGIGGHERLRRWRQQQRR